MVIDNVAGVVVLIWFVLCRICWNGLIDLNCLIDIYCPVYICSLVGLVGLCFIEIEPSQVRHIIECALILVFQVYDIVIAAKPAYRMVALCLFLAPPLGV